MKGSEEHCRREQTNTAAVGAQTGNLRSRQIPLSRFQPSKYFNLFFTTLLLSSSIFLFLLSENFLILFANASYYLSLINRPHNDIQIQRERKRWEFSESKYFSLKVALKYTTNSGVSHSKDISGAKEGIIVSKLHLLDDQKVAGEPDFDGGTGELKLLSKTSKGIQGP